ncbi:metallophosphoesterase [Halomarina ordinaria]|uniref:Metallophosphoesterase n=1 Tax=Halomarina ordinaria TaxID=3033939 RepID=A0ABD5UA95_9EURY|nr:metallophosphoesterase [Halomarina sp. PSRA2]
MTEYYFISDLHIGGDEQLQTCEFEAELTEFLQDLAGHDDAELVVLGDLFGLWEFTGVEGLAKLDLLEEHHPWLFEQLRETGETVQITLIPGNHDYELACYPEYEERLAEYNVSLERELHLTREVAGRTVWAEHGMQHDPNNRMPDFGNPHANPVGYFVVRRVVAQAGRLSGHSRYNWPRDIQSVAPMEEIPRWILSNYFYREMSPYLRFVVAPVLLLFNVSLLYLAGLALEELGAIPAGVLQADALARTFGVAGFVLEAFLFVNVLLVLLLVVVSIPLWFFDRDVRRTIRRFGLLTSGLQVGQGDERFLDAARSVFADRPDVAVYVYGHTHRASLTRLGDRLVLNTGTWLKRLVRVPARIGRLPGVYHPSFRLNYFRIREEDGDLVVEYERIEKEPDERLSPLQRLVRTRPPREDPIPERTVLPGDLSDEDDDHHRGQHRQREQYLDDG